MLRGLLALSATVFTLWMLVDAYQRRAESFWYIVILMPLGEWAYFIAVKRHDFRWGSFNAVVKPAPASLETLKRRLRDSPSDANRLKTGWAHLENDQPAEALPLFESVLRRDPRDPRALHGLGLARIDLNEPASAIRPLQTLVDDQPAYDDYEIWHDLAFAHWESENRLEAVNTLRRLVETSPRIKHKVILGSYLARMGEKPEARACLEEAIADFDDAPRHVRRDARKWVKQARAELAGL
ncbi:MAG: tetratricopeptide repeat protein [Myxococcota bacterium]